MISHPDQMKHSLATFVLRIKVMPTTWIFLDLHSSNMNLFGPLKHDSNIHPSFLPVEALFLFPLFNWRQIFIDNKNFVRKWTKNLQNVFFPPVLRGTCLPRVQPKLQNGFFLRGCYLPVKNKKCPRKAFLRWLKLW